MEFNNGHPLNNITRNNPFSMLEALIPFVDYPLKLPLALLVKYQEIRLIIDAFHSADNLSKYGLHNSSSDPMDMLATITGMSPDMLKTMMSFTESQNTVHNNNNNDNNTNSFMDESFDDNIKNIFAEYDLLQAADFNEANNDNSLTNNKNTEEHENDNSLLKETIKEPEYYI